MTRLLLVLLSGLASCVVTDHAPKSGSLPMDMQQSLRVYPLIGIRAVRVMVFGASSMELGYSNLSVENEIIDRMKKAGIEVEQVTQDPGVPKVVMQVSRGYSLPYVVEMKVTEKALLVRDVSHEAEATTWSHSEPAGTASEARDIMLKLADRFIKDFKLANP